MNGVQRGGGMEYVYMGVWKALLHSGIVHKLPEMS